MDIGATLPGHARSVKRTDDQTIRARDLGIRIGVLPSGPTASIADVPGVGVGHVTIWRDEPAPPAGRGVARTGVTVIDPGGNLFRAPVPAGGAVLNGAGECTGFVAVSEWGLAETPVFLTSTMQVGRVYDAACELLAGEDPGIGTDDVIIPLVAECDDSFLSDARRMQVSAADVRTAREAARAAGAATGRRPPAEGAVGAGTGMSCLGFKGGIGTASRLVPSGHTVGVLVLTNFGVRERLTIDGVPVGRLLPAGDSGGRLPGSVPGRASRCWSRTGRSMRPRAPGWPGGPVSAWPAPDRPRITAAARYSWRSRPGCAAPRGDAARGCRAGDRGRAQPVLRRGGRGDRGGRDHEPARGADGDRPGRQHLGGPARRPR